MKKEHKHKSVSKFLESRTSDYNPSVLVCCAMDSILLLAKCVVLRIKEIMSLAQTYRTPQSDSKAISVPAEEFSCNSKAQRKLSTVSSMKKEYRYLLF